MTASLCKSKQPDYRNKYERMLRKVSPIFAEKQRQNSRNWAKKNPERKKYSSWASHIKRTYGITVAEYDALLLEQGGGCKLCGRKPGKNKLPIDHDHITGNIRGILCTPCNRALGILERNINKVIEYLK